MLREIEAFLRYVTLIAIRFYLLTYLLNLLTYLLTHTHTHTHVHFDGNIPRSLI